MFLSTGNGAFTDTSDTLPALAPNNDFGESLVNLNPSTLTVQDFYTPSMNALWSTTDLDILGRRHRWCCPTAPGRPVIRMWSSARTSRVTSG